MEVKNNLETIVAAPIPVDVSFDDEHKETIYFRQINIADKVSIKKMFGSWEKFDEKIQAFNMEAVTKVLYAQLTPASKRSLQELPPDLFLDFDEDDKEVNRAPFAIDKMRLVLGGNFDIMLELFFQCLGTSTEDIIKLSEEFEKMPDVKKKETAELIKNTIGQ